MICAFSFFDTYIIICLMIVIYYEIQIFSLNDVTLDRKDDWIC